MAQAAMYGKGVQHFANGAVDWDTDTIKVMLVTGSYTPDQDAHDFRDDLGANEVAASGSYVAGGATIGSRSLSYDAASNEVHGSVQVRRHLQGARRRRQRGRADRLLRPWRPERQQRHRQPRLRRHQRNLQAHRRSARLMGVLACKAYDPAVAVSKATTAALAMTALDTTNLRLSFTVPASGMVLVRLKGTLHGATTCPQIHLGVLEGATVKGRCAAMLGGGNIAATTLVACEAVFVVSGLTPAANLTWDAAYGVETVVASTGLKYGGPNDTTANNAFGAFCFEIWEA